MKFRLLASIIAVLFSLPESYRVMVAEADERQTSSIETIGIYNCMTGMPPEAIPFFKACGYNTYQRWDLGWMKTPELHEQYYRELVEDIGRMKKAGFRVFVLLSVNMTQRQSGDTEEYRDDGFDPANEALMKDRLENLAATIRKSKIADGFTVCAGDPGGHPKATPLQLAEATKKVIALIAREAPKAEINVNTWGIAAWDHMPSPFSVAFWEKEVLLTRELISQSDILGPEVGMEFPMHNYYRSLALKCYVDAGKEPELFPNAEEVRLLRQRGVRRLWGWPYFLTDECNDGYPGKPGVTQSETRYIKRIADNARQLRLNGMVAEAFEENIFAESLNLYAFGRFCRDPEATCEQVIREFSGFVSQSETAADLADILCYIENHSSWQAGMPEKYRLPNFEVGSISSADDALKKLAKVVARSQSELPMMKTPEEYLRKVKESLVILAREK